MEYWEQFEINSCKLLNQIFQNLKNVHFKHTGGSDSTSSDIKLYIKGKHITSIQCKYKKSQSSQFVVDIDYENNKFILSTKTIDNDNTSKIISHMNNNFDSYSKKNVKSAIKLICKNEYMAERVISNLIKKSKFIISSNNFENLTLKNTNIFPVKQLNNYFYVSGIYRRKRSGTCHIPKKDYEDVKNLLKIKYHPIDFQCSAIDKKLVVSFNKNMLTKKKDRYLGEHYFLSKVSEKKFILKKRSNTNNANVIFSLEPKKNLENGLSYLKKYINSYL